MTINYPPLDEKKFLQIYLEMMNTMLPQEKRLVPSEIELMIEFAVLPEKFKYQRFGSLAKDKVIEAAKEKRKKLTKLNINNKLYALLDKEFLWRDVDKVIYMPKHFMFALEEFRKDKNFNVLIKFKYEEENRSHTGRDS